MGSFLEQLAPKTNDATTTSGSTGKKNVILPPGVDPYYGITISTLPGGSVGGVEDTTSDGSGSSTGGFYSLLGMPPDRPSYKNTSPDSSGYYYKNGIRYNSRGVQSPTLSDIKAEVKFLNENYPEWTYQFAGADASQDGGLGGSISPFANRNANYGPYRPSGASSTAIPAASAGGGMRIAKPNMTWIDSMPSVMPAGGGALAQRYGPLPFMQGANTPMPTPIPRQLTYNNPYNTNPYLPMSNPFALIANSPSSGS